MYNRKDNAIRRLVIGEDKTGRRVVKTARHRVSIMVSRTAVIRQRFRPKTGVYKTLPMSEVSVRTRQLIERLRSLNKYTPAGWNFLACSSSEKSTGCEAE